MSHKFDVFPHNAEQSSQITTLLPASLVPFIYLRHPTRGAIPGPFVQLPLRLQQNVLDVVWTISRDCDAESDSVRRLRAAVESAVAGKGEIMTRWKSLPRF